MWDFIKQLLFIDQTTKLISHSKMWSNVGYGIMCYTFVYAVMFTEADYMLWLVFAVAVIGNKTIKEVLLHKKNND